MQLRREKNCIELRDKNRLCKLALSHPKPLCEYVSASRQSKDGSCIVKSQIVEHFEKKALKARFKDESEEFNFQIFVLFYIFQERKDV